MSKSEFGVARHSHADANEGTSCSDVDDAVASVPEMNMHVREHLPYRNASGVSHQLPAKWSFGSDQSGERAFIVEFLRIFAFVQPETQTEPT